jgi:hypothetical protein
MPVVTFVHVYEKAKGLAGYWRRRWIVAEPTALNTNATQSATLDKLALGAPGLSIWRREESVLAALRPNES